MNIKEIREMIQLMNENNLSEIELEKEGLRIKLRKGPGGVIESSIVQEPRAAQTTSKVLEAPGGKETSKETPPAAPKIIVKSPMVGTFYTAPAPDAPPFVQVGSQVEVGQVICVIEAMKLMNEIKSEVRGRIAAILVSNGDPVEFGQVLFQLE